ncbi:primosomal protein N' [Nonomuraea aridisoli]|uniref:Probable replication restart protein PriA n=1 Tax=Nonomuraea aridisoli TaxID=2070368 RepID=A0A2W2EBF6_9ACTN|nr:primosomal protein N' [Nonomuraea aridisoli]PZG21492.1 primosomal protein N' [Nonomuraea aridisoli]
MTHSSDDALLPLEAVRPPVSAKDTRGAPVAAPERPVARVVVDSPLPHLDRPFDYLVPATLHETAEPGVRVRVRFAGKLVDGFLLERVGASDHEGRLTPLERVVSPERVLTPEIAGLARAVADRYAGTLTDVLRVAIPPRHAKAEAEPAQASQPSRATEPSSPAPDASSSAAEPSREAEPSSPAPEPSRAAEASREGAREGSHGAGGSAWDAYPAGRSFLKALRDGRAPRAVWSALPGARGWAPELAEAVLATLDGGRGAVVVVPDGKDVALADAAFARILGPGRHVALTADLGPAERYRRWLKVLRGHVRAVVGTRTAMFAPVADLGLVAVWDDGDDLHAERLAPYPHAREVLGLRAHRAGAAMLIGGYARTAEATQLVATGWARPIVAARTTIRSLAPRVRPAGEDAELAKDQAARQARLPSLAWRALRHGLERGPVLVQVPRRGYLPALACRHCRTPARCVLPPTRRVQPPDAGAAMAGAIPLGGAVERADVRGKTPSGPVGMPPGWPEAPAGTQEGRAVPHAGEGEPRCHGPLALRAGHTAPYCRWCGRVDAAWRCPSCGSPRMRAVVTGARRTAEELGRAFPSVPVRTSGRDGVLATVPDARALVVATPGAEPVAECGYAAAVLLDGWALLGRADLRAGEEAVRRWMNAAALLRPAAELVVLGDAGLPAVQALIRWDPVGHAERELGDRAELGFPPAVRMATLTGAPAAVRQMLDEVRLPPDAQVLGPVPLDDSGQERAMIRVRRSGGAALAAALKGASGVRAARKTPDVVRVSVDPLDLI